MHTDRIDRIVPLRALELTDQVECLIVCVPAAGFFVCCITWKQQCRQSPFFRIYQKQMHTA